jgi:pantothenate kinase
MLIHHLATLDTFDDPVEAYKRRGAHFTFDSDSFYNLVKTLRSNESDVYAPSFDHYLADPVPNSIFISQT